MKLLAIDIDYIRKMKRGDVDAFRTIYNLYCSDLLKFAFHFLKNKEEAEEVVQDIFLKIWDKKVLIDEKHSFNGFVFIIAKRVILNKIRAKVKIRNVEIVSEHNTTKQNAQDLLVYKELQMLSDRAISTLPEKRRQIFIMSRKQGLSNKEIATHLGISDKTVENQIGLALKSIREYLTKTEYSSAILSLFLLLI